MNGLFLAVPLLIRKGNQNEAQCQKKAQQFHIRNRLIHELVYIDTDIGLRCTQLVLLDTVRWVWAVGLLSYQSVWLSAADFSPCLLWFISLCR